MQPDRAVADLESFLAERGEPLLRTAVLLAGNKEAGEDLLHAALERLLKHWRSVQGSPERYLRRTDPVGADAVVGVGVAVAGCGLGPGSVGSGGGLAARQGSVRPLVVVGGGELTEQCLQLGDGGGLAGLGGEPFLHGLLESFDFALGLGVVRLAVLLPDAQAAQFVLQAVAAALAAG